MGNEVRQWPGAAKEGSAAALRSMPAIILGSAVASACIVQLLPSKILTTFLVANPFATIMAPVLKAPAKSFMLPINFVVSNVMSFVVALPFLFFTLFFRLSFIPVNVAKKCVGASSYAQLKAMHPSLYKTLLFVPEKLEAFAIARDLGNSGAMVKAVFLRTMFWFLGPLNEEVLFRGLVQGSVQRVIKRRTEPGSAARKRSTLALFLGVALWFGMSHAHNYLPLVQAISQTSNPEIDCLQILTRLEGNLLPLRFKSVLFIAFNQCLVSAAISFFLFSPFFARRGLVAAVAAHSTWNLFSGFFAAVILVTISTIFPRFRHLPVEVMICSQFLSERLAENLKT